MLGAHFIPVDQLAAKFAVARMEVEAMGSRNHRQRQGRVGAQVVWSPRLAGVVAGRCQAATESGAELLEAFDVVALPAVQGNRYRGKARERRVGVHAGLGVPTLRRRVRAVDPSGHHHNLSA